MLFIALVTIVAALSTGSADAQCLSHLDNVTFPEIFIDPLDPQQILPREYILCPNTLYPTGYAIGENELYGTIPLFFRSNATIKCGQDGKRENNCTILDGTFGAFLQQVDGDGTLLDNATIQGFTFQATRETAFTVDGFGGKIDIIDCAFLDVITVNGAVVLIGVHEEERRLNGKDGFANRHSFKGYHRPSWTTTGEGDHIHRKLQNGTTQNETTVPILDVTFKNCLFMGNIGAGEYGDNGFGTNLVTIFSPWQKTTFEGCAFVGNDFSDDIGTTSRVLIANDGGGELVLIDNCFVDNLVIGALVLQFSLDFAPVSSGNYVTGSDGLTCGFLSWFNNFTYISNEFTSGDPICTIPESDVCLSELIMSTPGPSSAPSSIVTMSPTGPTNQSATPTKAPTTSISASITMSPAGTENQSVTPTKAPTTSNAWIVSYCYWYVLILFVFVL